MAQVDLHRSCPSMGKAVVYLVSVLFELEGKLVALDPWGEGGRGCNTGAK